MLLRSVTTHVKEQNWTAIIIDFFIVVVGVFIGIQVANWNESRTDKIRATGYLERIAKNLETDTQNFNNRIAFWSTVSGFGFAALNYAESGEKGKLSDWEVLLSFFQASQLAEFLAAKSTYNEISSAGELGLIGNEEIRNKISTYYTGSDNWILSDKPLYREHIRGYIPILIQKYIWTNCYKTNTNLQQSMFDCEPPVPQEQIVDLLVEISRDKMLIRELRYWMSTMQVATLIGNNQLSNGNELYDMIKTELQANNK